jgi:nucleoside-diphosphate-sugar epimerase
MRVLILGGTGSIGSAVLREVVRRGHTSYAVVRSHESATKVIGLGAAPITGDIGDPSRWIATLPQVDAVVQMACDFNSPMEQVERRLLDGLLPHLALQGNQPKFIYTGGCWLFGTTGDDIATEETPLRPLHAFAWMVPHLQWTLESPGISPIVIHPAMVYEAGGGVFSRFIEDARKRRVVRVVGGEEVRWPLVHRDDLANLYLLALERGLPRRSYIGATIEGLPVGRIARAVARKFRIRKLSPEIISADLIAEELGSWARGYAIDQQMSGEKARRELGWKPLHLDPEGEIASGQGY